MVRKILKKPLNMHLMLKLYYQVLLPIQSHLELVKFINENH